MRIYECKYALDKNHDATDFPFARSAHSWRTLRLLNFYFNAKITKVFAKGAMTVKHNYVKMTKGLLLCLVSLPHVC